MRKSLLGLILVIVLSLDTSLVGGALAAPSRAPSSGSGDTIVQTALRYLGYAYTTVGNSPSTGFSCIGFVSYVYQANGIPVPDDLGGAMAYAAPVAFSDLMPGDVLYFQNTVWSGLSHTAIYLGGGRFVHAAWYNRGVIISSFTNDPVDGNYWMDKYLGANRPWSVAVAPRTAAASLATTSSTPARVAVPPLREGPRASIQVSGLNVRVRPSLFAPISRVSTEGTKVVVLKQYRTWDWVQLPDRSYGWVAGAGVGISSTTPSAPSVSLPLMSVLVDGLRVHTAPNTAAPVLTAANSGQKVLVGKHWNGWLWVHLPGGTRGWIVDTFVGSQRTQAAVKTHRFSQPPLVVRHTGATLTAGIRLRARPGLHAPVLGLAAAGTHIRVLGVWGNWVYARFPGGTACWVYRAYVHM